MILKEKCELYGNWLFKRRSYLPIVLLVLTVFALLNYDYSNQTHPLTNIWEPGCIFISFLGLYIRILTVGHTPKKTSGRNRHKQVARTLNTTGIYSIIRNPLYLGNFIVWLGLALFPQIWYLAIIYIILFWLYYEKIIFAEESFLISKFGDEYINWAESTPVMIPSFKNYKQPELPFSFKNILKREYNGFFSIILTFFVLNLLKNYSKYDKIEFDQNWLIFVATGFSIWLVLKILRRYTKYLHVKGR